MDPVVLEGRAEPADRRGAAVLELPFEVPPGTSRIDVAYRYDEGSVIDLGLADGRWGAFPSRAGFRGWSGGARERAFVATDEATPGYLAGPLPAGTWRVLLGLAQVADGGCAYRVEIRLDDAPRGALEPPPAPSAPRGGPGWVVGDLQSHTHHSDARGSLEDLVGAARERGLDYLAVTDHNTVSHHRAIARLAAGDPSAPLLLPGQEVTTYRGHANVWGARGWVDFRAADDGAVARVVAEAHALGGLFSVNHPKEQPGCIGCDWEYAVPGAADAFEAWQGPWPLRNWQSLRRYDALLARGRRLALVGGSDRHQPAPPERDPDPLRVGSPATWLRIEERSVAGLLGAIGAGRACVSESPAGPRVLLSGPDAEMGGALPAGRALPLRAGVRGGAGERLRWVGPHGPLREVAIEGDAFEDVWTVAPQSPFVRLEVIAADPEAARERFAAQLELGGDRAERLRAEAARYPWVRALSNPLYFREEET